MAARFTAVVDVRLKAGVLDPQGQAVAGALRALGFAAVEDVRVGKQIVVTFGAQDADEARASVERMCRDLLASPVLEEFAVVVTPVGGVDAPGTADARQPVGSPDGAAAEPVAADAGWMVTAAQGGHTVCGTGAEV